MWMSIFKYIYIFLERLCAALLLFTIWKSEMYYEVQLYILYIRKFCPLNPSHNCYETVTHVYGRVSIDVSLCRDQK